MMGLYLLAILLAAGPVPDQDRDPIKVLAGCYELRVLPTKPPDLIKKPLRLSRKFRLTPEPGGQPSGFVAKNLDTKVEWELLFASWTAKDADTIQIVWGTGFVGYSVRLKRSGADFRGKADYFDDTGGADSKDVVANTVDCEQTK